LTFNIFSALAQFERRLIQERTKAGLEAARAHGRNGGRPKISAGEAKVLLAKKLHADKSLEIDDICKTLRISRSTFYRYVRLWPVRCGVSNPGRFSRCPRKPMSCWI